jgi:glycosyltransferase involved in cell wall biosynthesis
LFYAEYNVRLFFYLISQRYDIACAVDLDTVLAVRVASFFKRKKTVHDAHEYFTEVPELAGRKLTKNIWQAIGKSTVKHFDARYTVGQHLAEKLSHQFNASFEVIRNLPSKEQTRALLPIDRESRLLVYTGALNEGRGIEEILQALRDLPGWRFRIAGEGDLSVKLRQLSTQLAVSDRVEFLGWVSPDYLPSIFRQATLGINVLKGITIIRWQINSLISSMPDYPRST